MSMLKPRLTVNLVCVTRKEEQLLMIGLHFDTCLEKLELSAEGRGKGVLLLPSRHRWWVSVGSQLCTPRLFSPSLSHHHGFVTSTVIVGSAGINQEGAGRGLISELEASLV